MQGKNRTGQRLCLIIPSLKAGGMERVISELAVFFTSRHHEVHLIIMTYGNDFFKVVEPVVIHKPKFTFSNTHRLVSTVRTMFFLRNRIKSIAPDVVLSFGETYNSFVLISTLGLDVRVFISDRSQPDKYWGATHELLRKILYPKAAGIVSQTRYSKDFLYKLTRHKNIKIIPNPVRITDHMETDRQNVILFVGRLIPSKRIDILLEVYAQTRIEGWQLWIVGDGNLREWLFDQSEKLKVSDKVRFFGNQKDLSFFYSTAKIFGLTSVSEGFPNALLEAMSWGLGCIAFDCISGPSDLIEDTVNGFLVPIYNKEVFANRLMKLQMDANLLKMISLNAARHASIYSIDKIGVEYLNFMLE